MAAAAAETRHHATTVRGELTILYASQSCAAEAATAGLLAPVARAAPLLYRRRRPRPGASSSDHTPPRHSASSQPDPPATPCSQNYYSG